MHAADTAQASRAPQGGMRSGSVARRGVLTMGYGAPRYLEMAKCLARSLGRHSPGVPKAVVTDSNDPELRALFDVCIPMEPGFGRGLRQKLHLDEYTPFEQTLFVDSDSLVVRDVRDVWPYFDVLPFAIPGENRLRRGDSDPHMDVEHILNHFALESVPKFNSGLIYFDSSLTSKAVFETARTLLANHRELRLADDKYLNDEPLFAIAMSLHGLAAVPDGGKTMRTPAGIRGGMSVDVARGVAAFNKAGVLVEPAVVHFAGPFANSYEYRRECYKLRYGHRLGVYQRLELGLLWFVARRSPTIQRVGQLYARAAAFVHDLRHRHT